MLARVEGEGAMYVRIRDGVVAAVELRIYEPPRFFEALLRGRDFREAPDITSRICGICPIAYQTSAINAIEDACGVVVDGPLRELRRLIYCGEWIESHALHVLMLHAPDFLGYESGIALARDHPRSRAGRAPAEEDREPRRLGGRRARDPSRQHARRRLLPRADATRAGRAARTSSSGVARSRCR